MLAHFSQHTQPSPQFIHSRTRISCSIKSFRLKLNLGLAVGESWLLLALPQKKHSRLDLSPCVLRPEYITFAEKHGCCLEKALFLSAHLKNCNVATCGYMLAHWTHSTQFSPPCIHSSDGFSCSSEFFCLKIALLLVNSKSWALLAQPQGNTDVYCCLFPWESFNRQTCKNHLRPKQGHRLKKDLSIADKLQWCHVLAHWTQHIQPSSKVSLQQ